MWDPHLSPLAPLRSLGQLLRGPLRGRTVLVVGDSLMTELWTALAREKRG